MKLRKGGGKTPKKDEKKRKKKQNQGEKNPVNTEKDEKTHESRDKLWTKTGK